MSCAVRGPGWALVHFWDAESFNSPAPPTVVAFSLSPEGMSLRWGSEPCNLPLAARVEESGRWTAFWHSLRATQSSYSRVSCPAPAPRRGLWKGAGGRSRIPPTLMCSPRFKDQQNLNWFLPTHLHGTPELCQSCPSMGSTPGGLGTSALCGAPEKPWLCSLSFFHC